MMKDLDEGVKETVPWSRGPLNWIEDKTGLRKPKYEMAPPP